MKHRPFGISPIRIRIVGRSYWYRKYPCGGTDLSGSVVIADAAEDVVEDSSRNEPTTMKRQMSFAEAEGAGKKRVTRRQRFLDEMEKLVPWSRLLTAIEPYYPKGTRGRPPIGLERMLRIYFLQQWYSLSDEGLEDALYDSIAMRALPGLIWPSRMCRMRPRC